MQISRYTSVLRNTVWETLLQGFKAFTGTNLQLYLDLYINIS
jgi:hypothetical protein